MGSRDSLLRVIARRLALSVPLLLIVTASTFVLVALIPGDAARTIVGGNGTEAQYEALRHALGLDQSLPARFWEWLEHAVQGDLGTSLFGGEPVASALNSRLGVTLSLVGGSTLLAAVLGIALGIAAALRPGWLGRALDGLSLVGLAVPNFFLGLLLVSWFAVSLRLFPATGYVPPSQSPSGWLQSLVLPVITLALPGVAVVAKQTRDSMREALERPFVQTLRATGISRRSIVLRHALRSGAISIVTVVGLVFVGALSGAVVVESVFALPGLGSLAVQATTQRDLPLIQGVALYFTVIVIAVNLAVDLLYGWLDPRVAVA
jgi:peptide/nickel transport system permease protein